MPVPEVSNINRIIDLLICPASKAMGKDELSLEINGSELVCGEHAYPIDDMGIPNLRLPFNQEDFTSYDDILGDFLRGAPKTRSVLDINCLTEENVTNKIILLGGTGAGTDIDWIMSLKPELLICLDYSPYIKHIAQEYVDVKNIVFVVADICDLPFRSGVFDLVISNGIIQHTRSPEMAFSEKVRTLSTGGVLSIGNLYSKNEHNHFVSMYRHKYCLHEMPREQAKRFIKKNAFIYYWMAKAGLSRIHRRFHFPGILHYASNEARSIEYHYNNATDFYMAYYRHLTSPDEVKYWCDRLGVDFSRTPKGYLVTKKPSSGD